MSGQDCRQSVSFRGGSLASRIALQESVCRLLMSVTCGRKCGVLLERLNPDGLWEKTCGDYSQVSMEFFSVESSGTLPNWGMMLDGELRALPQLEPCIDETGWRLLPTPVATDYKGGALRKDSKNQLSNLKEYIYLFFKKQTETIYLHPQFLESMMGFPVGWTELSASETP